MDWRDLLTAFALYLLLDGIMPFVNPGGFKRVLGRMRELSDVALRGFGAAGISAGLLLLYWVR